MSEPNENITEQPQEGPRTTDLTNEVPRIAACNELEQFALQKSRRTRYLVLGGLFCFVLLAAGLGIVLVARVQDAFARSQSQSNLRRMGTGLNNLASNSVTGDIPPANGVFPDVNGMTGSFFFHLLPYIEEGNLAVPQPPDVPVRPYIAPADTRNPGTNSTISYCTNGTLLNLPKPTLPGSFGGRTSSVIVVMERSGLDGAHRWTNSNNVLGTPGNPPPFPQMSVSPSAYLETSPQGFTSAGCLVSFGDGSARTLTKGQATGWNWACDPTDKSSPPTSW